MTPFAVFAIAYQGGGQFVASVQRRDGEIGLPGGKVEPGETPEDAVRREAAEEGWGMLGAPAFVHDGSVDGKLVRWYLFREGAILRGWQPGEVAPFWAFWSEPTRCPEMGNLVPLVKADAMMGFGPGY